VGGDGKAVARNTEFVGNQVDDLFIHDTVSSNGINVRMCLVVAGNLVKVAHFLPILLQNSNCFELQNIYPQVYHNAFESQSKLFLFLLKTT
jgi:hypothetical protein